jgi:transposase
LTGSNPTDRGKLEKRHVLTDQNGISLSITITSANTHDMKAATETLDSVIVQVIAALVILRYQRISVTEVKVEQ